MRGTYNESGNCHSNRPINQVGGRRNEQICEESVNILFLELLWFICCALASMSSSTKILGAIIRIRIKKSNLIGKIVKTNQKF